MRQGILFDLDGTLWDSSRQVVESWNVVLEQQPDVRRRVTMKDIQGFMGLPMDEIGRRCFRDEGLSEERNMRTSICGKRAVCSFHIWRMC